MDKCACGRKLLPEQGSLTIVRRSSGKGGGGGNSGGGGASGSGSGNGARAGPLARGASAVADDDALDAVDLSTDNLPAVDTPDACDKAALRLRCLLRQLQRGEISAEILQKNLHYAARVLEAVFIDETKERAADEEPSRKPSALGPRHGETAATCAASAAQPVQRRRLRTPVWARRLADEDDELSEVQPDAVPPEVREWLASTFTRQLATTRRKADEKPKFRSVAHAIRAGIFVDRIYRRVTSTSLMQFPPDVVKVLKTLDEWSFDVFALSETATNMPVKYLGYDLLNRYGMIHKFKVPPSTLEAFLTRIEEGYCRYRNPYHNNLHAADVAQTVHYMLCQTGLMNWLTDLEIFATLVAALIHDYEHTGTTNNFHVMSGTETALLYNDRAVLENHHISASFRVMRDEECNILQNLSREEFREFRTLVIDMVLATDMSFHFQQLKNMRNLLTLAEASVDKSKALSLVLHCCDISHPAKRWDLHHRWTSQLLEEFFRQGDKERELGLPFSPLCDRNNTLVAESQIGFIEFIVEPSMAVCSDMLEAILGPLHSSCKPTSAESIQSTGSENAEIDRNKNGSTRSPERGQKYTIKKPWIGCLAENKRIWKEQAAKDAEARAQQQQNAEENNPTDVK
ncbi:dual specificity calcium/calmodulin-dependent 3',5'-cyclic nucleotide phosphodiesterase 1-like isoform X3 [Schistocerca gregaria]|uniref:dual specificity calcium/calmodulin-dependent 3',5'-cyclic nucleotide phosphodiesterase 1-like isoform X3 n=1 Tax=Schistocerca gregaria TaxID=7010 RepID=UPI00211EF6E9|nr:dual specificity calcium/calmodulin-dependent 3',5'-cyclic nucleotide phosphodiesterase 1-like isoform X3 [Schistocerca gregaria]